MALFRKTDSARGILLWGMTQSCHPLGVSLVRNARMTPYRPQGPTAMVYKMTAVQTNTQVLESHQPHEPHRAGASAAEREPARPTEDGPTLPHVAEFVSVARAYLSDETIVISSVRDAGAGVVDVVFVGTEATVAFVFGRPRGPMPSFADVVYYLDALDVAHGLPDVLYVVARNHASLFRADARLRLVPHCSSRILASPAKPRSSYVGQGDDGQPIVIRERVRQRREDMGFAA